MSMLVNNDLHARETSCKGTKQKRKRCTYEARSYSPVGIVVMLLGVSTRNKRANRGLFPNRTKELSLPKWEGVGLVIFTKVVVSESPLKDAGN